MACSPSEQSPSDRITDVECSEPQVIDPSNGTETLCEALCDLQTDHLRTQPQNGRLLADNSQTNQVVELSRETVPLPQRAIPSVRSDAIQSLLESNESVEQTTHHVDEELEPVISDLGQQNHHSIDLSILAPERPPLSRSSDQVRRNKRKQEKQKFSQFCIVIEEEPEKAKQYDAKIPEGFTELFYRGQTIPVYVEQLYGTPLLGHGAFGSVYAVVIEGPPDILIAVKRVSRSMYTEVITMEIVGSGSCPYIVEYYGAVANPGTSELCICMEFMDASVKDFYQAMHSMGEVTFNQLNHLVRRIIHDIASGLYYLEIKEIVHRDVKPANMLVNMNAVFKLCDFGISRTFHEMKLSLSDDVAGTRDYMPSSLECTIQDDMWALGISLLEIIQNKNPFADKTSYGKAYVIVMWEPSVPPTISEDLQQLILHLLKKEAQERPPSYVAVLNKSSICNVAESPSYDECDFVHYVLERITRTDGSK